MYQSKSDTGAGDLHQRSAPVIHDTGFTTEPDPRAAISAEGDRNPAGLSESAAALRRQITQAMQAAALHERERILVGVDDDLRVHELRIHDRATEEAAALQHTAGDDIETIERWSKDQIARIRAQTQQRIAGRRNQLGQSLAGHGTIIESEVARVRQAVEGHRAELDTFFVRLTNESDPSEIARLAALLPGPPDLDDIGASARADAVAELGRDEPADSPVAVMDPAATGRDAKPVFGSALTAAGSQPASESPGDVHPATDPSLAPASPASASTAEVRPAMRLLRSIAPWAVSNGEREADQPD